MKGNILLKLIAVVVVCLMVVVLFVAKPPSNSGGLTAVETGPASEFNGLGQGLMGSDEISAEYGVDVDSPVETMRTLTNETRAVRKENDEIMREYRQLKQSNDRLLKMEDVISKRVENKMELTAAEQELERRKLEEDQNKVRTLLNKLENRMAQYTDQKAADNAGPAQPMFRVDGAGIPSGLGYDAEGNPVNYDEIVWEDSLEVQKSTDGKTTLRAPSFDNKNKDIIGDGVDGLKGRGKRSIEERLVRAYTIPRDATLIGSVAMTALLGRIPIDGGVQDPYPFKIIIGEENLSSNGIEIPDVTGITMTGLAKGDWALSCVSGQILSMTFTFSDGTIRTVPDPDQPSGKPIAWFSDEYGIPCVTGQRITNAVSFLSSRVALSAASSYNKARADAEFTTTSSTGVNGTNTSKILTGNPLVAARNTSLADGIDEITDWLDARQANSFDAIYVEPGTQLAIHITEQLKIDYDPEGRKVNHYADLKPRTDTHID